MVASPRQRLILPLAPLGAGVCGVFVALTFLLMPTRALESLVLDSGIPAILEVAQPPLHTTARLVLALGCGAALAGVAWFGLFVAFGARQILVSPGRAPATGEAPTLRRADAHPDAPPRKPLSAVLELGTPFLEVRAAVAAEPEDAHFEPIVEAPAPAPFEMPEERPLPTDLDIPLVAYDPVAMFSRHNRPASAPAPAPKPALAPRERLEVFELTPMVRASEAPSRTPADPTASIRTLLDRLESSVAKRDADLAAKAPVANRESIRDTLDTLRTLATR